MAPHGSVVGAAFDVAGEGPGVAFVAHEAEDLLVDAVGALGVAFEVVAEHEDCPAQAVLCVAGFVERLDGFLDDAAAFGVNALQTG